MPSITILWSTKRGDRSDDEYQSRYDYSHLVLFICVCVYLYMYGLCLDCFEESTISRDFACESRIGLDGNID